MKSMVKNRWQFLTVFVGLSLVFLVLVGFRSPSLPSPPFTIQVNFETKDVRTGNVVENGSTTLNVSPDGAVCSPFDDGQPHTIDWGNGFTETVASTCSGTFQGGNLSYTQTVTSDTYSYADGTTCTADTPYRIPYTGTFDDTGRGAGTIGEVITTLRCPSGNVPWDVNGLWTGQITGTGGNIRSAVVTRPTNAVSSFSQAWATAESGFSQVNLFNCHDSSLNIWVNDLTAGDGWQAYGPLDSMWDTDHTLCPGGNQPLVIQLVNQDTYQITAVDPACDDPTSANCVIASYNATGASTGPVMTETIS